MESEELMKHDTSEGKEETTKQIESRYINV